MRQSFNAIVTRQDLADTYLPPFEACVAADVSAVMCSYNAVNGVPSCGSEYLQETVLRRYAISWTDFHPL